MFSNADVLKEFKSLVCMPYFKDIYKDLASRSEEKSKGVNKVNFLDYCNLPGVICERFFEILDIDKDGFLN